MSRNIQSLSFGVGIAIVAWVVSPYMSADVDNVWWVGQLSGTNDIIGREFLASSLGLGGWIMALVQSVSTLERKN